MVVCGTGRVVLVAHLDRFSFSAPCAGARHQFLFLFFFFEVPQVILMCEPGLKATAGLRWKGNGGQLRPVGSHGNQQSQLGFEGRIILLLFVGPTQLSS